MDAPDRGALILVRFIAAVLIGWTLISLGLYWAENYAHHLPVKLVPCIVRTLPLILGIVILVKATAIAEWISNQFNQ